MLVLNDRRLFKKSCYIDGEWICADSGETISVCNPATGVEIGLVPKSGAAETKRAIEAANRALPAWRARSAQERSKILRRWFELMVENQEDLALIMTAEQGKPLSEAREEIAYAASFLEWFAEEGKRVYGDIMPSQRSGARVMIIKQPMGVCAAITPWNFPSAMVTRKVGPALAAGCTMVLKPASLTPYSALALAELASRAGVPAGVFSVITGASGAIGAEMTGNPIVRKLTFTGSTEIGKHLMAQCAGTVKKLALELGGNAPFIVFDDVDLDAAVEGAILAKYRNAGQTGVCANRFLVQDTVYEAFAAKLVAAVKRLRVGDGLKGETEQGPLIDMDSVEKVEEHIADAVAKGARVMCGGKRHLLGGSFFEPTVLAGVTRDMMVAREETFGPLAPLFRFGSEEDVVRMANDTEFGLAAYVYSKNPGRVWRLGEALKYGIVGVNTGLVSSAAARFGGVKESGLGREGSMYGMDDYLETKYICMGGI